MESASLLTAERSPVVDAGAVETVVAPVESETRSSRRRPPVVIAAVVVVMAVVGVAAVALRSSTRDGAAAAARGSERAQALAESLAASASPKTTEAKKVGSVGALERKKAKKSGAVGDLNTGEDFPTGTEYPNTGNCLLYKMAWPASHATDDANLAMKYACNYTAAPNAECGTLTRCYVATALSQGVCDFELHWVEARMIRDGSYTTEDWEKYFKKINRNMTVWNAFMHNGVQLFVPDVQSIMTKMDEDGTPYMVRSSGESAEYTHVLFEVTGRVWELIGISNMNNDDGASGRTFGRAECPAAHEVRHPDAQVLYDAWDASGSFERPNGLMQPMLMRTTVSASEPQLAAAVYYESLHKVTGAYLKASYVGTDCEVWTVGFDQGDFIEMQFVKNLVAETGDWTLHDYDNYVQQTHNHLIGDDINLWDHWLDQHVGFMAEYKAQEYKVENDTNVDDDWTYECDLSQRVHQIFSTLGWPTGTRTGVGCVGETGNDDCTTTGNHAYMGVPHSNMAFEYNTDCIDDHAEFPSVCLCDAWNNNIHYGEMTGETC